MLGVAGKIDIVQTFRSEWGNSLHILRSILNLLPAASYVLIHPCSSWLFYLLVSCSYSHTNDAGCCSFLMYIQLNTSPHSKFHLVAGIFLTTDFFAIIMLIAWILPCWRTTLLLRSNGMSVLSYWGHTGESESCLTMRQCINGWVALVPEEMSSRTWQVLEYL